MRTLSMKVPLALSFVILGLLVVDVHAQGVTGAAQADISIEVGADGSSVRGGAGAAVDSSVNITEGVQRQNACEAGCRDQYGGSGSAAFDACIRACSAIGPASPAREECPSDRPACPSGESVLCRRGVWYCRSDAKSMGTSEVERQQYNETDLDFLTHGATVKAVEVRGWDPKQKQEFLATVKAHAEVKSGQDLENFAKGVLLRDDNIDSVVVEASSTQLVYRMPARFLGVFETSLAAHAEVMFGDSADGRVKVKFPWFSFLYKKLVSSSELEAELDAALPEVGDEVLVGFEHRAETIQTLSNVMKTKHDTVKNSIGNIR